MTRDFVYLCALPFTVLRASSSFLVSLHYTFGFALIHGAHIAMFWERHRLVRLLVSTAKKHCDYRSYVFHKFVVGCHFLDDCWWTRFRPMRRCAIVWRWSNPADKAANSERAVQPSHRVVAVRLHRRVMLPPLPSLLPAAGKETEPFGYFKLMTTSQLKGQQGVPYQEDPYSALANSDPRLFFPFESILPTPALQI